MHTLGKAETQPESPATSLPGPSALELTHPVQFEDDQPGTQPFQIKNKYGPHPKDSCGQPTFQAEEDSQVPRGSQICDTQPESPDSQP